MLDRFVPLAEGLDHPEGVAWGPDGRIYAGGEAGQVYAIDADGTVEQLASTGGFLYGITVDGNANVYGCDIGRGEVARISPDGSVRAWTSGTKDRPLRVPNFSAFDDLGRLYVTDSGEWSADDGLVFRVEPDGRTMVWTDEASRFPNGCCVSADGGSLFVVESSARRIVRVPIGDDGSAGRIDVVADLTGSQPDGLALARDGTMFVGCYRPDRIWRIPPGGEPEIFVEDPDGIVLNQPANVAFVGPDLDRLVVSSLGGWNLVTAHIGTEGLPLRYPKL